MNFLALTRTAAEGQSLSILATANYTHLLLIIKLIRQADLGMPPAEAGAERGQAFAARGGLSTPSGPRGTYDLELNLPEFSPGEGSDPPGRGRQGEDAGVR